MRRMISRSGIMLLMCGLLAAQSPPRKAVPVNAEPHHHQAFANQYVRVFKVEVAPKTSTLLHHHAKDYVWVGIGASHFINKVEGKAPVPVAVADGQTMFAAAPVT